jgi:hypothetical protein
MSYEKHTVCHTAEDLFEALKEIPQGYREKMELQFVPDEDVPDGEVHVNAYFVASSETDTGYESGLQICSNC